MTQNNPQNALGHIFIIDDDDSMRKALQRMLKEAGYSVEAFESAKLFLEKSFPISPATILLDMQMPDMTGVELQEQLIKLGRTTPIIFISGQSQPVQIIKAMKCGALNFLLKPFNPKELLDSISEAMKADQVSFKNLNKNTLAKNQFSSLTNKEREVYSYLIKGMKSMDIATTLRIVPATVKVHKSRILEKMNVNSAQELIRKHLESGLTQD
jgi:FixJ family two-component response regulator